MSSIPLPILPTLRFDKVSAERASSEWRFSCGPAALCAALEITPAEIRPYLPNFPGYMTPSSMGQALVALGARHVVRRNEWPELGVVRIQFNGPWLAKGVPPAAAYKHTHWVACHWPKRTRPWPDPAEPHHVFDVNVGEWLPQERWSVDVVPLLLEGRRGATGEWSITHCFEIRRPDVFNAPPTSSTRIYVDPLRPHGLTTGYHGEHAAQAARVGSRHGHQWCHLFADGGDCPEIHEFAKRLGLRREWFDVDHYDLTPPKRALALQLGAVEVETRQLVEIRRTQRHVRQSSTPKQRELFGGES